jgi:hypothetical protein
MPMSIKVPPPLVAVPTTPTAESGTSSAPQSTALIADGFQSTSNLMWARPPFIPPEPPPIGPESPLQELEEAIQDFEQGAQAMQSGNVLGALIDDLKGLEELQEASRGLIPQPIPYRPLEPVFNGYPMSPGNIQSAGVTLFNPGGSGGPSVNLALNLPANVTVSGSASVVGGNVVVRLSNEMVDGAPTAPSRTQSLNVPFSPIPSGPGSHQLIIEDANGKVLRTQPLVTWPKWPINY